MVEERKISQLPTRTDITGEEYMHIGFNGRSYKTTVNSIIAKFNGGINLEVLQEIQDKLTELAQMGDLVTAEELTTAIAAIPAVDLSSFATSTAVADAIAQAIAAIPAVDLSGYVKTADLPVIPDHSDFALKADIPDVTRFQTAQEVAAAISQAAPDLSNLATKNEIPSLEGLARLSDIPAPADLTNIYNKQEIDQKLVDIAQGEAVDLSGYATTVYVDGLIAGLPLPDMSEVALKSDIPDVSGFITAADIPAAPDLSVFLTAEDLPTQPDLSDYATKAELPDVSGFLTASDLPDAPDLSIYATKEELTEAIDGITAPDLSEYVKTVDLPEPADLSGLATKLELGDYIKIEDYPEAPDLSDLVTKLELRETVDSIDIPSLEGYATLDDIPAPADLSGYVTAEVLDSARVAIGAEVTEAISTDLRNNRFVWVSAGPLTGKEDGTLMNPYRTVMDALAGTAGASNVVINLIPVESGSQTEDVTIDGDRQNILIQGYSTNGDPIVIIDGTFTITGDTTRIRVKDLGLRGQDGNPALVISGSIGLHYFDNVDFSQAGEPNGPLVVITDRAQRWVAFTNCGIYGDVDIADMDEGGTVYFNGHNSGDTCIYINTDAHVYVKNSIQIKYIEQNFGTLDVRHVGLFTGLEGTAILSNAGDNRCYVSFCDFEQADGSVLNVTGGNIILRNCNTGV